MWGNECSNKDIARFMSLLRTESSIVDDKSHHTSFEAVTSIVKRRIRHTQSWQTAQGQDS